MRDRFRQQAKLQMRQLLRPGGLAAALIAVASLAFGFEGAARLVTRSTGRCHPTCFTEYDQTRGWINSANSSGRHRDVSLGFDVRYSINAQGFRGEAILGTKTAQRERIIVLGDSNGFGWGVEDGRQFSALVQAALERVEVANLSVTGFGTDQEYLQLLSEGPRLAPDLVVLQVTPNDFDDIQSSFTAGRPKPWFTTAEGGLVPHNIPVRIRNEDEDRLLGSPLPITLRWWLSRHSYAYVWLNDSWSEPHHRDPSTRRFNPQSINLFTRLVSAVAGTAHDLGAELLVVHASSEVSALGESVFPSGTTVLDLSAQFREAAGLFADGLHWNTVGHALVAKHLAAWYAERPGRRQGTE